MLYDFNPLTCSVFQGLRENLFLLYTKSCTWAIKTTISDKNKWDTSCCVVDHPLPLFNVVKRSNSIFLEIPKSFCAIDIDMGEGDSKMLWCQDLFGGDCVHYRTVESCRDLVMLRVCLHSKCSPVRAE